MRWRAFFLILLTALLVHEQRLQAEEGLAAHVEPITTTASDTYPQVTCTTNNTIACADVLQLAADTRDQLGPLLQLGPTWRFPVPS